MPTARLRHYSERTERSVHALNTESGGPVNHDSDLFTENSFFYYDIRVRTAAAAYRVIVFRRRMPVIAAADQGGFACGNSIFTSKSAIELILSGKKSGMTACMVTHDPRYEDHADRVLVSVSPRDAHWRRAIWKISRLPSMKKWLQPSTLASQGFSTSRSNRSKSFAFRVARISSRSMAMAAIWVSAADGVCPLRSPSPIN